MDNQSTIDFNPSPNLFTLLCFTILIFLVALAVLGVIVYVHRNNELMKTILKNQNHKEFESFRDTIKDMNSGLVNNIIEILRDKETNKQHIEPKNGVNYTQQELLNTFSRLRNLIKEDLSGAINTTKACRIALYLFHNGTKSTQGISFVKVSWIGEKIVVGSGIKERIIDHSALPINLFDDMINKLIENGKYIIINDSDVAQTNKAKFISNYRIRYVILTCLYDNNNNVLGFVLGEFDHAYTKALSDKETEELQVFAAKISPLLSFSEYAEITLKNPNNTDEQNE